ncbi:MAG: hypothetical protein HN353_00160 [Bdellovibrionales bacterium]|nr:hypothetical protein [Bdellovibrionales bacterium]MBT3526674.1 hypothetical protein [Bdellovibrionales bacterium]
MSKLALLTVLIMTTLTLTGGQLKAAVWESDNTWDLEWEKRFSSWMKSSAVHRNIFTNSGSNYYGIRADCADASYALRIIFSYENHLPFAMRNPSGSRRRSGRYLTNQLSKFDSISDSNRRVVKFINYIAGSVGTESLVRNDTFSPALQTLRAGDLFMYRMGGFLGRPIRHSYNIKRINPTGDFALIYSTQALAREGKPLNYRDHRTFTHAPRKPWGFRRFKWPQLVLESVAPADYPVESGYSLEQFSLVERMGGTKFFKYLTKLLKSSDVMPGELLEQRLTGLCREAQARIGYVNQGVKHANRTGGRCMNFADFDAYSTPARDSLLANLYQQLLDEYNDLTARGELDLISLETNLRVKEIFSLGEQVDSGLQVFCPISYRDGVTIDLAELFSRQQAGVLSSHPNDSLALRWGEADAGEVTSCRRWY